jgi:formylglycine-generating enzyme required for sulfatase activity
MGTDDVRSLPNERPADRVQVEGVWMDEHHVTNAGFARFVDRTGREGTRALITVLAAVIVGSWH